MDRVDFIGSKVIGFVLWIEIEDFVSGNVGRFVYKVFYGYFVIVVVIVESFCFFV